jgi:hypothetical protein
MNQGTQGYSTVQYSTTVKIHHAQRSLQFLDCVWPGKIKHLEICVMPGAEAVPQKVQLLPHKLALLQVDGQAVVCQTLGHGPQALHMLVHPPAGYPLVI